jgi:hypothetical protein
MIENIPEQVELKCVFCHSTDFEVPHQGYVQKNGETAKCANCGRLNDVTSLSKIASDNVKKEVFDYLLKSRKNLFKK